MKSIKFLFSFTPRGDATPIVLTIVTLIIIMGGFMVGGVLPNFQAAAGDARFPPEQKPLATPTPRLCADNTAIDILVDSSHSMFNSGKMQGLQSALKDFTATFSDNYLVAMQSFGDPPPTNVLPFTPYKDAKNALAHGIDSLHDQGATYMRDAFADVKDQISAAQQKYPNYHFNLVFISDGVPEIDHCDVTHGPCDNPNGNYDYTQDPTRTDVPDGKGDIAEQIQGMGVQVYTIGLYDETDVTTYEKLFQLLDNIATSQDDANTTSNPLALTQIYGDIADSICPPTPSP